jgi:Ser/Thr protein kinase RdoA (MazF antagonist)
MWGWPVQDIATTLYYVQTEENYAELRAAFREGYQRIEAWPDRSGREIDAFMAARALGMLNFVLVNQELVAEDLRSFSARTERRLRQLMQGR